MQTVGTLGIYLERRQRKLRQWLHIAERRANGDIWVLNKKLDEIAVTIGQLSSKIKAHALEPIDRLFVDRKTNSILSCDPMNLEYSEINPDFDFKKHSSLQFGENLYTISYATTQVTRIENVLSTSQNLIVRQLANLNKCHWWHMICKYKEQAFYIIGGTDFGYIKTKYLPLDDVHRFDLRNDQFVGAPSLNEARYGGSACELDGLIYAFWGKSGQFKTNYLNTIEMLDVASQAKQWQIFELEQIQNRVQPLICPIKENTIMIAGGVKGGYENNDDKFSSDAYLLKTRTNQCITWIEGGSHKFKCRG